ncbi:hypothetical protein Hanom_Chr09g00774881 [Helianthus anomalus]
MKTNINSLFSLTLSLTKTNFELPLSLSLPLSKQTSSHHHQTHHHPLTTTTARSEACPCFQPLPAAATVTYCYQAPHTPSL